MSKTYVNSFGTYLATLRHLESAEKTQDADAKIQILGTLAKQGPLTLPELAAASGVSSPMVIESIEPMVGLDLVQFAPRESDESPDRKLAITQTGFRMLDKA